MAKLYCTHCGTIDNTKTNYHDSGEGHWEYSFDGESWEILYCCHKCCDNNEPCESFFPIEDDIDLIHQGWM